MILTPLALAFAVLLHAQAIPAIPALAAIPAIAAIPALAVSANSTNLAFTDITAGCGLDCTPTSGATPSTQILEVKGGGLALIDFDNDGDLDVFVPNGATLTDPEHGPGARMFRNDGAMHFTDVTASSAIKHNRWSFGVTVGDVDADGFDDIFIACFGPDVLLRNKGNGTFEDITARSGIHDDRWGTSAAFADLDLDGDLDLFVCNYIDFDRTNPRPPATFKGISVISGPKGYPAAHDAIYENKGDGTFIDRSEDSGIATIAQAGFGLNLAILDFTGDGKPDIYVGNDSQANNLFVTTAPWKFRDDGLRSGIGVNCEGAEQATMGVAIADIDANGRPDVFTTNFSSDTNTLHLNLDGRSFDDRTNQFGLGAPSRSLVGWGAGFFDFDLDADEDLLVVNGHVYPQATKATMDSQYAQGPLLMERRGARFAVVTEAGAWKLEPHVDRTAVFADLDQDGDVDMIIAGLNEPLRLIRNDHHDKQGANSGAASKNWITVIPRDLRKGIGNRHAIGAQITVTAGDLVQRRWMVGGGPFQSNNAPEAYFGLGEVMGGSLTSVDITVRFADGTTITRKGVTPGTRVHIDRE